MPFRLLAGAVTWPAATPAPHTCSAAHAALRIRPHPTHNALPSFLSSLGAPSAKCGSGTLTIGEQTLMNVFGRSGVTRRNMM